MDMRIAINIKNNLPEKQDGLFVNVNDLSNWNLHSFTKKILNIVKESFGNLNVNKSQGAMDFNLPLKKAREQWEKVYLSQQLKINDGNISKTSKAVGMERSALHRKLSSLGIKI